MKHTERQTDVNRNNTQIVKCKCGNVIYVRCPEKNTVVIKKHGKVVTVEMKNDPRVTILCEKCGVEAVIQNEVKK